MKSKWLLALTLGAALSFGVPTTGWAQGGTNSDGQSPSVNIPANGNAKGNVPPNGAAGSPGSLPETSLSSRNATDPATREGDVPRQIGMLLPAAALLALVLVGGLYWFVFRKATTPEGEAASKGQAL